jgi:hypothetical protein
MVPQEEVDRVLALLRPALQEAYKDFAVPPVEIGPGYWTLWPARHLRLVLEEPRYQIYGVPYGGTGNLRVLFAWPYQRQAIRLKNFDERSAKKISKRAVELSKGLMEHYNYGPAKERAYIEGYKAVQEASEEDLRHLWVAREPIWNESRPNWDRYHKAVQRFLRMGFYREGVLDWIPEEEINVTWTDLQKELSDDSLYDTASRGVSDALDDWAVRVGLLDNAERLRT